MVSKYFENVKKLVSTCKYSGHAKDFNTWMQNFEVLIQSDEVREIVGGTWEQPTRDHLLLWAAEGLYHLLSQDCIAPVSMNGISFLLSEKMFWQESKWKERESSGSLLPWSCTPSFFGCEPLRASSSRRRARRHEVQTNACGTLAQTTISSFSGTTPNLSLKNVVFYVCSWFSGKTRKKGRHGVNPSAGVRMACAVTSAMGSLHKTQVPRIRVHAIYDRTARCTRTN